MAATKTPTLQDVVSDDLNYERWAPIVKTNLTEKGLWDVVENGVPPNPSKIPELATKIQPEDLSKWRDFVGKDTKALQILQSCLPETVFRLTLETASAKDLWDLLKSANEQAKLEKKLEQIQRMVQRRNSWVYSLQNLTFNSFSQLLGVVESLTVDETLYDIVEGMEFELSSSSEYFIAMLASMSDLCDDVAALVMETIMGVKNLTFNSFRELLDVFESVPMETIDGIMKGFEGGSSSQSKEVCASAKGLKDLLIEANEQAKLDKEFKQVRMEEGERISSSQSKEADSKRVMRSRHERGECIQCGGKGHVFKDCINRKKNEALPEYQMLAFNVGPVTFDKDMWMIYTSTSNHMTPYEKYFTTLDRTHRGRIKFITGHSIMSEGMGDIRIMTKEGKKKTIKNVLFVPKIDRNVLSVGQMAQADYGIVMTAHKCTIKDQSGRLFGESMWEERGFFLRLEVVEGDWWAARRPNLQDIISDDLNIEVWSAMMKTTLTEKGLWDVVANEIPPDPSKIPELAAKIQAEELCNWRELAREDMKALQILQSSLTDSVFRMTLSAASAKDLWDMLNEVPDHVIECFDDDNNSPVYENVWKISSTNTNHITSYEKFFTTLDRSRKARIKFTSGYTTMAEGIGDMTIMTKEGKKTIKNVLYVPEVLGNALSVSQMLRSGFEVRMDRERCTIWDRTARNYFGETMLGERGFRLRLDVIEGHFQSKKRKFTQV
ncbi:Zinc finger CCHC-type [Arabidopsis suecica]|uniref:Zinc finger CCHC-type n=1 Tax=Arabidopsis suecica TaxID=45249 RepID=A0A8T2BC83_ARASU|nr:Zinc finger CCHC-type [Arabidopsis suecica]